MRTPISKDVDPGTLADQLTAALGIPVAVSVRQPGQKDDKGKDLPGVVVLLDATTGQELPDQDAKKVADVLAAHVIPPDPVSPAKALADALGSAATLADLKAALVAYAGTLVSRESKGKGGKIKP